MNFLYQQRRGDPVAVPQPFDTYYQAQLALDHLLAEHRQAKRLVCNRVVGERLRWEVHDLEGLLCSYWLAHEESLGPQ